MSLIRASALFILLAIILVGLKCTNRTQGSVITQATPSEQRTPFTIMDYFDALYDDYFFLFYQEDLPPLTKTQRHQHIRKLNLRAGYMVFARRHGERLENTEMDLQMALFRHGAIEFVILTGTSWHQGGSQVDVLAKLAFDKNGVLTGSEWNYPRPDSARIERIKINVPPSSSSDGLRFILPEQGTTIQVKDYDSNLLLYYLDFVNGNFVIRYPKQ